MVSAIGNTAEVNSSSELFPGSDLFWVNDCKLPLHKGDSRNTGAVVFQDFGFSGFENHVDSHGNG